MGLSHDSLGCHGFRRASIWPKTVPNVLPAGAWKSSFSCGWLPSSLFVVVHDVYTVVVTVTKPHLGPQTENSKQLATTKLQPQPQYTCTHQQQTEHKQLKQPNSNYARYSLSQ